MAINTRIIDAPSFAWDLTLSGSTTQNKILELGEGVEPDRRRASTSSTGRATRSAASGRRTITASTTPTATASSTDRTGGSTVVRATARSSAATRCPPRSVAQQPLALFNGRVRHRHPVRLPRRPPDRQLDREVPLLLGAELPRPVRPDRAARGAGPRPGAFLPGGGNRWPSSSPAGSSSCGSCRSPSTRPTAGRARFRAEPAEPHARRPEPVDHHRLHRRRPRGQRLRRRTTSSSSDFESQPQVRYWTARLNVGF